MGEECTKPIQVNVRDSIGNGPSGVQGYTPKTRYRNRKGYRRRRHPFPKISPPPHAIFISNETMNDDPSIFLVY